MSAGSIRAARAFVELHLNSKEFSDGLTAAKTSMTSFANTAKSVGANMIGIGVSMSIPFALAAKEFATFEQEMATVGAVTQATAVDFETLTEEAKRLGLTTTFTATEAAEAMTVLGRAGFNTAEIMAAIPHALSLARATATDLGESARIAAAALRVFGLNASETGRVVDTLTATSINSAQTLEGLGEGLKFVGPFARQAGISIEKTSAIMGILADNGIRGTVAGTGFARVLKNLSQTPKVKLLEELGVDVKDSIGNFREIEDILGDLNRATAEMGSVERTGIFEQLFGRGAASAIVAAEAADRIDEATEKIEDMRGVASKTAKIMDNTLAGSFRLATSAAQGLGIAIGD